MNIEIPGIAEYASRPRFPPQGTGMSKHARAYAIAAAAAIAALLGTTAYFALLGGRSLPECGESRIAGGASLLGGPFTLVDGTGAEVDDADVIGKPALVYFGYTFCPDVCPLDNARNAAAIDLLAERGYDAGAVFISIDPERDDPGTVKEYAGLFHPEMIGLTGSAEQVADAAKAFRVYYQRNGDDEYYLMDHSSFTYLVFPGPEVAEYFRREQTPEQVAETVQCFVDSTGMS